MIMKNRTFFWKSACLCACISLLMTSCKDTDDFGNSGKTNDPPIGGVNTFDFSTSQEVDLIVDFSDLLIDDNYHVNGKPYEAKVPVFFRVYNKNPFVNENTLGEYIDESIKPIFAAYTEPNGKYDETITLPAYATRLHIVTGNFVVGLRHKEVAVENGEARWVVKKPSNEKKSMARRVAGAGQSTNDLSKMPHLYKKGNGTQVYKPWVTPLGTWNSASGRPDYLLDTSDQTLINKGLVFSEKEFNGMFGTACDALNSGTNLKEQYRAASDLLLKVPSEVSITAMGSSTCWNSSLGYYYYNKNNPPQNKMDLNIIMLFPNTQDGEWPRGSYPNNKYNGNIGALRGDVVQLKYYPPTLDGGIDIAHPTDTFPADTKIGFILKTNAWGQRGNDYAVNGSSYAKAKNIWASTTDGMSSAFDSGVNFPNENGEARSAKFAYTAPNGNQYVVVSFEDACDDKDYDDLMFALNPANAFDLTDAPKIVSNKAVVEGVYGFEDKWPEEGDYDMNDLMINCKHELEWYTHPDGSKKLNKERFYLTTYHNYITLKNGLAVDLQGSGIQTIYVNKLLPGQTEYASETYTMKDKKYYYLPEIRWGGNDDTKETRMWYVTDDITKDENPKTGEGVTWVFEVTYAEAKKKSSSTIRPFLWRKQANGKQLEVHLPWVDPTNKADMSLFGTGADKSDPNVKKSNGQKMYYVRAGNYPFAFYLEGVSIDAFKETVLKRENESRRIDEFFPGFLEWSISEGKKNSDWYMNHLSPVEQTEIDQP